MQAGVSLDEVAKDICLAQKSAPVEASQNLGR